MAVEAPCMGLGEKNGDNLVLEGKYLFVWKKHITSLLLTKYMGYEDVTWY